MLQKMRIEEEINDSCNCITLCGEIIDCPKEDQKSHLSISTASGHEKGIHVLTIKTKSRVELCGVHTTQMGWKKDIKPVEIFRTPRKYNHDKISHVKTENKQPNPAKVHYHKEREHIIAFTLEKHKKHHVI